MPYPYDQLDQARSDPPEQKSEVTETKPATQSDEQFSFGGKVFCTIIFIVIIGLERIKIPKEAKKIK